MTHRLHSTPDIFAEWFNADAELDHLGHFTFRHPIRDGQQALKHFRRYTQELGNVDGLFRTKVAYAAFAEMHGKDENGDHVVVPGAHHVHALLGATSAARTGDLQRAWKHGHARVSRYDGGPAGAAYVAKTIDRASAEWDLRSPATGGQPDTSTAGLNPVEAR